MKPFLPVLERTLENAARIAKENESRPHEPTLTFWQFVERVQQELNIRPDEFIDRAHIMIQLYDSWQYGKAINDTAEWIADSLNLE